jgi:hypothetical protein
MMIKFRPEDMIDPFDSAETLCRTEDAKDCDGGVCGTAVTNDQGNIVSSLKHDHLIISGYNPLASPRYFVVPK